MSVVTEEQIISDLESRLTAANAIIEDCQSQIASLSDKNLKLLADTDNFRKRLQKESQDAKNYALTSIIQDFLKVYDNLNLAVQSGTDKITDGVKIVISQIETILAQYNCKKIKSLNEKFDPSFHEAVISQPSKEHVPMTIIKEMSPGFILNDRVIRPSKVIVAVKE